MREKESQCLSMLSAEDVTLMNVKKGRFAG